MTNLSRLHKKLNEKEYFQDWETVYAMILEENGLDPESEYSKENDQVDLLESVYSVIQTLANNIDNFMRIEVEFTETTSAYSYLQTRLKDIRKEINRIKKEEGTDSSRTNYLFFNSTYDEEEDD